MRAKAFAGKRRICIKMHILLFFLCTVPCVGLQYRSKMCENVKFVKSAKKAETK